jgi:hypothetical protein
MPQGIYNQQADYGMAKSESQPAELPNVATRLQRQNAEYSELLYSIEDKLHSILNLRLPQNESQPPDAKPLNDFCSTMQDELGNMSVLNSRLQQVLDHVKRIIG